MLLKTSEERLVEVEKNVASNANGIEALREDVAEVKSSVTDLSNRMDRRFEAADEKMERRFQASDEKTDRRFEALLDRMDRRFDAMDRKFWWLVGVVIASQAATITVVATMLRSALDTLAR